MAIFKKLNDSPWDANKPSRKPGDEIGPYEIVRSLGVGAIGEVYLVKQPLQNAFYALKLIKSEVVEKLPALAGQCIQEAKIVCNIRHPNIVAIHDAAFDQGKQLAYITMEYVEGCSLAKLIKSKPLTVREAFQMALGIAEALNMLNKQNYIHYDVKPENIMMAGNGDIKLADFGVAGVIRQNQQAWTALNSAHLFALSPYASPEQVQNSAVDFRSDIFSLGATLYHAVSGQKPFDGASSETIASSIINDPPPPLMGSSRSLKPEYVKIIEWMLEKDPAKRPQSYEMLMQMLKAVLECEQVRSPKTLKRLQTLMMKQHLMKRVWIEPAMLKKITRYAIVAAVILIAIFLIINYQHIIREKFASSDNEQPVQTSDASPTPAPQTSPQDSKSLNLARQRQIQEIKKELDNNAESTAMLQEFFEAAKNGKAAKLMEINIRLEPDSDVKDENGDTPAILAAKAGSLACLRYLAKEEFDIYSNNARKENILNISIPKATNPDIINFIIHSTARTDIMTSLASPDQDGNTPFHLAAANTHINFMPLFLKYLDMVNINAKNDKGFTALEIAVKNDNLPAARTLIKYGAIITEQAFKDASQKMLDVLKSRE